MKRTILVSMVLFVGAIGCKDIGIDVGDPCYKQHTACLADPDLSNWVANPTTESCQTLLEDCRTHYETVSQGGMNP